MSFVLIDLLKFEVNVFWFCFFVFDWLANGLPVEKESEEHVGESWGFKKKKKDVGRLWRTIARRFCASAEIEPTPLRELNAAAIFVLFSAFNRILKKIKFQFLVLAQFGNLEANAGLEKEKNSQRKNREEKQSWRWVSFGNTVKNGLEWLPNSGGKIR